MAAYKDEKTDKQAKEQTDKQLNRQTDWAISLLLFRIDMP